MICECPVSEICTCPEAIRLPEHKGNFRDRFTVPQPDAFLCISTLVEYHDADIRDQLLVRVCRLDCKSASIYSYAA